jgi:hypothetical protein
MLRLCYPRDPDPSVAIVDSQSVKPTVVGGVAGYDAGKQVYGRKRHSSVDTLGLLLVVVVTAASVQDASCAPAPEPRMRGRLPRVQQFIADARYKQQFIDWWRVRRAGCRSGAARRAPAWVSCVAEALDRGVHLGHKGYPGQSVPPFEQRLRILSIK